MSTDKLRAVHEALADVFSESPLISTDTEPLRPAFDHKALSEVFSETHLNSANTEQSFPLFDHAALAGIFSEPLPVSTNTKPSPTSFDHQAFAEMLSEHPPISTNTKPSRPSFDHQALAEVLSERPPTSTNTKSPPSFDHPALAETLGELGPVPINPQLSPLNFDTGSSSASFSGQPDNAGPAAKTVVAHPTDAESALPQRANSLLAALRVLIPTNAKPSPPILEKEPSRPTLAGEPDNAGPAAKTVAVAHPTDAESALPQQAKSLLTEMPALNSTDAKPSPPIFEKEPSRPPVSDQPANVEPTAKAVAVAPPADTESAVTRAQQAKSLLAELDLNTAIRLRWVMRDIRSKRTKLSPVSDNDLTALMDLGLVEMREELPRLTALGVLALD